MAKKKSKKMDTTSLVVTIVILALAVLTICTLFMPVFKNVSTALTSSKSTTVATGSDLITACFNSKVTSGMSANVITLVTMKNSDSAGFVTTVLCWVYFLTVLASAVVVVFAILSMLGMKFKMLNTIFGGALVILAILTLIFGFVTAGKFGSVDLFVATTKTHAGVSIWLMIGAMLAGCANVYQARK